MTRPDEPSAEALAERIFAYFTEAARNYTDKEIDWPWAGAYLKHVKEWLDRFRAAGVRAWQPIETAPKDGTVVDLLTRDGTRITDVRYIVEDRDGPGAKHLSCIMDGWKTYRNAPWSCLDARALTHWMPLPEPPHDR